MSKPTSSEVETIVRLTPFYIPTYSLRLVLSFLRGQLLNVTIPEELHPVKI